MNAIDDMIVERILFLTLVLIAVLAGFTYLHIERVKYKNTNKK